MRRCTILLLMMLCAAGCSIGAKKQPDRFPVTVIQPSPGETQEEELKRIVREADPIIENILTAINTTDHAAYIRDFNQAMQSAYHDKKQFKKINKWRLSRIGTYTAKNVWKIEKQHQYYIIYYWAKFTKAQQPVTVRLVLERPNENEPLKVAMLSYNAPELTE
ncbi:MAG: hypothetical protein N3B18_07560 [Desulfobacterota bacterium]|nr:hypothetical protein [Thermodesulfobacteriota bacterium]